MVTRGRRGRRFDWMGFTVQQACHGPPPPLKQGLLLGTTCIVYLFVT